MNRQRVAIVGATGAVGKEILSVLEKRGFPCSSLKLFASQKSLGSSLSYCGESLPVDVVQGENAFANLDLVFFATGQEVSEEYVPRAVAAGALVIDNSSAFRLSENVPLIVPEINAQDAFLHQGLLANPNCSTILLLMAVFPVYRLARVTRIIVSTYQSVSGAGIAGIDELLSQAKAFIAAQPLSAKVFPYPIAFNLFCHDSLVGNDGYNAEESKMILETRKILRDQDILVNPTCVRVPVFRVHCESVSLELERRVSLEDISQAFSAFPGLQVLDSREDNRFPMPCDASEQDEVFVGRLRYDLSYPKGISFFLAGDQLLKGAALNAVQIAETVFSGSSSHKTVP